MQRRPTFAIWWLAAAFVFAAGCRRSEWSVADRANIEHYVFATDAYREAVQIVNDSGPGFMSEQNSAEVERLWNTGLDEVRLVRDEVLAKAHPDLPKHFRDEFQKSLELHVQNFQATDTKRAIENAAAANKLHDDWIDWYNANNDEIRIPKRKEGFFRFCWELFLACVIFGLLFTPSSAIAIGIAGIAFEKDSRLQFPLFGIVLGAIIYAGVGFAAYLSSYTQLYTANPGVIHKWLYYMVAFWAMTGTVAGAGSYALPFACVGFVLFSIWPSLASWSYGWLLQ